MGQPWGAMGLAEAGTDMHEVGLASQIVGMVVREAERRKASEVVAVTVTVGRLLQIERDSLQFGLDVLKGEHPCTEKTRFVLVEEPVQVHCSRCEATTVVDAWRFVCGACGSGEVAVTRGDDLIVSEMEVNGIESIAGTAGNGSER